MEWSGKEEKRNEKEVKKQFFFFLAEEEDGYRQGLVRAVGVFFQSLALRVLPMGPLMYLVLVPLLVPIWALVCLQFPSGYRLAC
jgi:hypothetical protein